MLSLLISIGISIVLVLASFMSDLGTGSMITAGVVGFLASLVVIGLIIRKKTEAINAELQEMMMSSHKRMNHKIQQFQSKPGGNIKLIQRQIEADQKLASNKALEFIENFEPMRKWNILMGKQITTMRLQFLYQLKEFKQVDELLAIRAVLLTPLLMEPLLVAMKMARQFKNDDVAAAEKTFKRHVKWFRGARAILLYGTMSWIYVKTGEVDKARQLLSKGKESTGDETLARNWELLANGNEKKFTNAGLGEEWFSLYLENPPNPKQQRMRQQGNRKF